MPTRKPIIPGFSGPKKLLKSHRPEVHNRKPVPRHSSNPRGHYNSNAFHVSDHARRQLVDGKNGNRHVVMGRNKGKVEDYIHGAQKHENEDASSSSGPEEDDDDDEQDESDDNEEVDNDFDDASNSSDPDDGYGEEREARETDDRIAWENTHNSTPGSKLDVANTYVGGERFVQQYPTGQATRDNAIFRKRASGPTSYVRLVKETEDEIELIRRKHDALLRQQHHGQHMGKLSELDRKEIMAKRKSTNSITLMYGRPKNDGNLREKGAAHAGVVRSGQGQSSSISARALEVEAHLRRIKGGRVNVTPIDQRRNPGAMLMTVNGKTTPLEPPRPKPRAIKRSVEDGDSVLEFPLRELAVSETHISMSKAKSLERAAKQKTKLLKGDIGWAKLDVADARLGEFTATLRARQAQIEERQAKLCRRRAALKKAEDEQDALEAKMDEKEEEHRARERRIKNRERRVRQEEAGIKLKEESLRKREEKVRDGMEQIERRRVIVEEKEEVQKAMNDIMEKKEELHGRDNTNNNNATKSGIFAKLLPKSPEKRSNNRKKRCSTTGSLSSADSLEDAKSTSLKSSLNAHSRNRDVQNHAQLHATTKIRATDPSGKSGVMGLWI